jgi:hypothetical protein
MYNVVLDHHPKTATSVLCVVRTGSVDSRLSQCSLHPVTPSSRPPGKISVCVCAEDCPPFSASGKFCRKQRRSCCSDAEPRHRWMWALRLCILCTVSVAAVLAVPYSKIINTDPIITAQEDRPIFESVCVAVLNQRSDEHRIRSDKAEPRHRLTCINWVGLTRVWTRPQGSVTSTTSCSGFSEF